MTVIEPPRSGRGDDRFGVDGVTAVVRMIGGVLEEIVGPASVAHCRVPSRRDVCERRS